MPDGFDEALTRTELTDLLAFLQAEKTGPQTAPVALGLPENRTRFSTLPCSRIERPLTATDPTSRTPAPATAAESG